MANRPAILSGPLDSAQMQHRLTRREAIGAGVAVLAIPAIDLSFHGSSDPAPFRAIYDERFAAGLRFASEAGMRGWVTRAIRGDVTNVWYHELAVRWKRGPASIVGVTTEPSLFVLERLAWDVGMRVTARHTDTTTHMVRWQISLPRRERPR